MRSKILFLLGLAMSVTLTLSAQTVVDIIIDSDDHNTLEAAVIAAELDDDLAGTGPFTVFAPTDAAFAALPAGVVDALLQDPTGRLADILLYHVVGAAATSGGLTDGQMITTLQGQDVTVAINGSDISINGALVTVEDIPASNGVVHVINAVLLPTYPATVVDVVVESDVHNTLEAAVIAAELADDLSGDGPFTVFAPTDAAFDALPAGVVDALLQDPTGRLADILLYHVVGAEASSGGLTDGQMVTTLQGQDVTVAINGGVVTINGAEVIIDNIYTGNGIVHVIDAVLLPTYPATVVDVVVESDVHNTLEAAVIAAELADDLSGDGPFTVFAPTDAAFDALPDGLLDELLMDPTGDLASILQYHVVAAEASSGSLSDGQMIPTLLGESVMIGINGGTVTVDQAEVIVPNIYAGNGIVHVIDAVLLPNIVSVREVGESGFGISFFPNPVSDYLMMDIQEAGVEDIDLILFNSIGQPVRTWQSVEGRRSFDLHDLTTGTYFLEIRINGKSFHKKLLKQ